MTAAKKQTEAKSAGASHNKNVNVEIEDSVIIQNNVRAFLRWYRDNYKQAKTFRLTYPDERGTYQVDRNACKNFLAFLKSSSYISDEYIRLWQEYFDGKAEYFKENPQSVGPPEGFEFDLVLISQEPELIFQALENLNFQIIELTEKNAILQISGDWGYEIELSKTGDRWLIDYISTLNFD